MSKPTAFANKVYKLTKQIPKGKISTYKAIAEPLNTKAYQAVGQALRNNPYAPIVPCHRVISSNGTMGGFNGKTSGKEIQTKKQLLKKEGISFKGNKVYNPSKVLHIFK